MVTHCLSLTWLAPDGQQLLGEWARAVAQTPQIFRHIAFRRRTLEEELQEALLRGSLRKAFGAFSLWMLGLGIVVATGWAQLTGTAAQQYSGPGIVVSYMLSGVAALLAACCFAELCAEFPVSGGAFSYIMVTFGELPAFFTLASLLLEYALGMAAVARGFTMYLTSLLNLPANGLVISFYNDDHTYITHTIDPLAAGIVLLMSVLLSMGVRESAWFISSVTILKLVLIAVVAVAGYTQGGASNMTPFLNTIYDTDGLFLGAAIVFFAHVGFDAVANAAEEVADVRQLPWAIVGTVALSILIYSCLALALALLVFPGVACPDWRFFLTGSNDASQYVTFISAFINGHCMKWMQYVVSLAVLLGAVTALTVGLFSASRIVMAAARDWLLPPFLARISPRTQTPLLAQMVLGVIIAVLAMLVEVDAATALVSFGTLIVLWMVCNAQMFRRYYPDVQMRFTRYGTVEATMHKQQAAEGFSLAARLGLSLKWRRTLVFGHLAALNALIIALSIFYAETSQTPPVGPGTTTTPGIHTVCGNVIPEKSYSSAVNSTEQAAPACVASTPNRDHQWLVGFFALAWVLVTASFQLCCPVEYHPEGWHIPWWLMPWLPSAATALVMFCLGALPVSEYWKVGVYMGVLLSYYLLYSLPMSYIKHSRVDYVNTDELKVVELVLQDGEWRPARLGHSPHIHPVASGMSGLPSWAPSSVGGVGRSNPSSGDSQQQMRRPPSTAQGRPIAAGEGRRSGSVKGAGMQPSSSAGGMGGERPSGNVGGTSGRRPSVNVGGVGGWHAVGAFVVNGRRLSGPIPASSLGPLGQQVGGVSAGRASPRPALPPTQEGD